MTKVKSAREKAMEQIKANRERHAYLRSLRVDFYRRHPDLEPPDGVRKELNNEGPIDRDA